MTGRARTRVWGIACLYNRRAAPGGDEVRLVANLTPKTQVLTLAGTAWRVLLDSDAELFGGTGTVEPLAPYQCLLYEARR